jgi:RNA polymerase sigma-70 factor (ECF subfamily)
MDKSDEDLIADYLAGDKGAFDELTRRHLKPVYSFALRFLGQKEEAEDIAQETFVKAWSNLAKYNAQKSSFKTWVLRIARNASIDFLRKKKHIPLSQFEHEGENVLAETVPDAAPLAEELFAKGEDSASLARALQVLPPRHRELFVLYYTNELTFEQIGEMLGEPANTVKSRHRRALLTLRKHLNKAPK